MSVKINYANIQSATRGMRRRGIVYREHHGPHRAKEQVGRHFDLDSAHVVRWTDRPSVEVTYYYFNARNEPKHSRGAAP